MSNTPLAEPAPRPAVSRKRRNVRTATVTPAAVTALQAMRAYPSISLLATTRPGHTMHRDDLAKLQLLAEQAHRRLEAEGLPGVDPLLGQLDSMVALAAERPTGKAVALFTSAEHSSRVDLSIPVVNHVIDPTFATRDLVRALHSTPRHAVLLLSAEQSRLLHGSGSTLTPAPGGMFPLHRRTGDRSSGLRPEPITEFLRRVDRALTSALRLHPMPLVLAAAEPTASSFRRASRNTERLAGTIRGNRLSPPGRRTGRPDRPGSRRLPAQPRTPSPRHHRTTRVRRNGVARHPHRLARRALGTSGTARRRRGLLLSCPVDADGDGLTPATDVDHPEVIDDIVDELIEIVLARGGSIALLPQEHCPQAPTWRSPYVTADRESGHRSTVKSTALQRNSLSVARADVGRSLT